MRPENVRIKSFHNGSVWMSVGAPIMALLIAIAVSGFILLHDVAAQQDRSFEDNTRVLVDRSLKERALALKTLATDYADWDAAYQAISVDWDQEWVEQNMYMVSVDNSAIFRPGLGIRYSYSSKTGEPYDRQSAAIGKLPELEQLVENLLRQPNAQSNQGVSSIINSDGLLAIVYMTPFRPTGKAGKNAANSDRRDIALVVDYVPEAQLAEIAQVLNIREFRFIPGSQQPANGNAAAILHPVSNSKGQTVGWMSWKHEMPGTASFKQRGFMIFVGLALCFVLSFLISARLVADQQRVLVTARQTAEAASKSKSEFLSNMSHELRTPLNSVIGYAEIIQEDIAIGDTQRAGDDAGRIKRSAIHLLTLINDILDHSKIEAGKMDITPERTDLLTIVDDVVESLDAQAQANKVTFVLNCDPQTGSAMIDAMRFKQCLLNITGNAVKFTKGGTVTLAMRPVTLDGIASFRVSISDTGIGMTEDARSRIFKPFEQADGSTTRNFGGTGLGLTITKHLVEAMDGQVLVESEVGKGSTFTLIFPTHLADATGNAVRKDDDQIAA